MTVSVSSIDAAITQLKDYKARLKDAETRIVRRMAEDGAEQAKSLVDYMDDVDNGELSGSITGEANGNRGRIVAGTDHAAFVEFGTGVVGARNPHVRNPGTGPSPVGWAYDVNNHGDAGWMYPGDDGHLHWTKGMPSRPYMYDTSRILEEAAPDIVREEIQK